MLLDIMVGSFSIRVIIFRIALLMKGYSRNWGLTMISVICISMLDSNVLVYLVSIMNNIGDEQKRVWR